MTAKIDIWNMALDCIGESDEIESEEDNRQGARVCSRHWDKLLREVLEARPWPFARRQRPLSSISEQIETTAYADVVDAAKLRIPITAAFLDTSQIEVVHIASGGTETTLTADTDYSISVADEDEETGNEVVLVDALASGESVQVTISTSRVGWEHIYTLPSDCVAPQAILVSGMRQSLYSAAGKPEFAIMLNDAGDGRILCCDIAASEIDALEYTALVTEPGVFSGSFTDALVWRLAEPLALAIRKDPNAAEFCRREYYRSLGMAGAFERNIGNEIREPDSPSVSERG